jgi:hypothetical protein
MSKAMGGELNYAIKKVVVEEVGQDKQEKPILYFKQARQGLVLNRSNADRLAATFGDETDAWGGKRVTLTVEPVRFGGRMVPGIVASAADFLTERRPPRASEAPLPLDDDPDLADDPIA